MTPEARDGLAEAIAGDRRAYRTIASGWCPKCGKFVAGVVATEEGPVLFLQGGRSGSHAEMVAEFELSLREAQAGLRQAEAARAIEALAVHRQAVKEFEQLLEESRDNRYPAFTPPMVWELTGRAATYRAACGGCHRDVTVNIDPAGRVVVVP